jgi:hypothetical protein
LPIKRKGHKREFFELPLIPFQKCIEASKFFNSFFTGKKILAAIGPTKRQKDPF